jgi:TetR/AcrR family transcriptional regulator, transcriptional repressor for nem operon
VVPSRYKLIPQYNPMNEKGCGRGGDDLFDKHPEYMTAPSAEITPSMVGQPLDLQENSCLCEAIEVTYSTKDDLLVESLSEAFREFTDTLVRAAEQSPSGEAWKAIVKTYLRPEMCEHPERGCPFAALAPELARVDKRMKPQIVTQLVNYKSRMVPFMPGRRTVDKERAFFAIFSTMMGAIEIARMLPDPAIREKVLWSARDFLLRSF